MYVPKDPQLHHDIVHAHHDSMMTGQGSGRHWSWSPAITGGWASPTMLPAMWQGAMSATAASPSQCRRWGSLPQTGSQPAAGRLSLLTPSENYQSLKDTMPFLYQWIGYPSASMPYPPLPQLTPQQVHTFSLSISEGTTDFRRLSSVTAGAPLYPISQEN